MGDVIDFPSNDHDDGRRFASCQCGSLMTAQLEYFEDGCLYVTGIECPSCFRYIEVIDGYVDL